MIPFNVPFVSDLSRKYALEALAASHQQGDGLFGKQASREISKLVGGGQTFLVPSCTHALEMASMLAEIGPGDEVIVPSYNFTSAAIAVAKFGGVPVFVDVDWDTKCINTEQIESLITNKTKAISWVNYAGNAPDMISLKRLAEEYGVLLIEDNAHGLGGTHKGAPLGSFGDFAAQSFHATKNIQCGEGGALVINNSRFSRRAEIIREKGTNRASYIRGEIHKYQWMDLGSSYLLPETLSAVLLGQLESFGEIQSRRAAIWLAYFNRLSTLNVLSEWRLPEIETARDPLAHMFELIAPSQESATMVMDSARKKGVSINFHYQALHKSPAGIKYGRSHGSLPATEDISSRLIRLPLYPKLSTEEINQVCEIFENIK